MENFLTISEVAKLIGVTEKTIRTWDDNGKLVHDAKTSGGHRRYLVEKIQKFIKTNDLKGELIDEYNSCVLKDMQNDMLVAKENREKIVKFMKEKGLIKGETKDDLNLALLLNTQLKYSIIYDVDENNYVFLDDDYIVNFVVKLWNMLEIKNIVNFTTMENPTAQVYYLEKGENNNLIICDDVVKAHTRSTEDFFLVHDKKEMSCVTLDQETLEPNPPQKIIAGIGLKKEDCMEINVRNTCNDITNEIINDVSSLCNHINADWQELMEKTILEKNIGYIITNEIGVLLLENHFKNKYIPPLGMGLCSKLNLKNYGNLLLEGVNKEQKKITVYCHPQVEKFLLLEEKRPNQVGGLGYSGYYYFPYIALIHQLPSAKPENFYKQKIFMRYGKKVLGKTHNYFYFDFLNKGETDGK